MKYDDSWVGKRVLITGIAGFIGSALGNNLIGRGAVVDGVDDLSFGDKSKIPESLNEMSFLDVSDRKFYDKFKGRYYDYIFHFGAPCTVRMFQTDPLKSTKATLEGFSNVLLIAEGCGARMVYPSSGNVYGDATPNAEHITPLPTNLYGLSKYICERMARHSNAYTAGLRIFAGYGPGEEHKGEYASVVTLFLNMIKEGKRPTIYGDGTQTRDFVYIDDIVDGILAAATHRPMFPIINIGTGTSTTFNELVEILNKYLNKDLKPIYVPKPKSYVQETKAQTGTMKRCLGIKPRPLKRGLMHYLRSKGLA